MRTLLIPICVLVALPNAMTQVVQLHHINVGQGHSTLVVGPTGVTCLVDGGEFGQGTNVVLPYLLSRGIGFLDHVVVTHFHSDHWRGIPEVVQGGVGVGTAWDRGTANLTSNISIYTQALGSVRTVITPGTVIDLGGGATLTCITVNGQVVGGGFVDPSLGNQEENGRSISLRLDFGGFQAAITGDLTGGGSGTADVESVAAAPMGDVDLLVAGHHGSNTSTHAPWLTALQPEVTVIPCGDGNPYGHPHVEPLQRLAATPSMIDLFRLEMGSSNPGGVAVNGTLFVQTDGSTYSMIGGQVGLITRSVDAGAPTSSVWTPGTIIISEYMNNPSAVSDTEGEWVELFNGTSAPADLQGFRLRDQGTDVFTFPSVTIPARGYLVVARQGNPALNGGVSVGYTWPANSFFLGNGFDEIILEDPSGQVLDAVFYDDGATYPDPNGRSVEREDLQALPSALNFAVASGAFGAGDQGSPGFANSVDITAPWPVLGAMGSFTIGTTGTLELDAGGSAAGLPFVFGLSECSWPGVVLPSTRVVPVCFTPLLQLTIQSSQIPGVTANFQGALDPAGRATGQVSVPAVPSLVGATFFAGAIVLDPGVTDGVRIGNGLRLVVN